MDQRRLACTATPLLLTSQFRIGSHEGENLKRRGSMHGIVEKGMRRGEGSEESGLICGERWKGEFECVAMPQSCAHLHLCLPS